MVNRSYKAIELTFEKRFSGNWQALVNYTLGRAYGNQFASFASQLFDFAGRTCNVAGVGSDRLRGGRTVQPVRSRPLRSDEHPERVHGVHVEFPDS